jgi:hypothetical protein
MQMQYISRLNNGLWRQQDCLDTPFRWFFRLFIRIFWPLFC